MLMCFLYICVVVFSMCCDADVTQRELAEMWSSFKLTSSLMLRFPLASHIERSCPSPEAACVSAKQSCACGSSSFKDQRRICLLCTCQWATWRMFSRNPCPGPEWPTHSEQRFSACGEWRGAAELGHHVTSCPSSK